MKKLIKQNLRFYSRFLLFIGAMIAFICSFGVSSYAWSENADGNLVSDNILNLQDQSVSGLGVVVTSTNGIVTINGVAKSNGPLWLNVNLPAGSYSLSLFNEFESRNDNFYVSFRYNTASQIADSVCYCDVVDDTSSFVANNIITLLVIRVASGVNYDNVILKPMVVSGSIPANSYESYGSIYYSQSNYNSAYYANYSLFNYCTKIDLTCIPSGSSNTITDTWSDIHELLLDKSYITCNNGLFSVNWSSFTSDYTSGVVSNVTFRFYFTDTYPLISLFNSFIAVVANGSYQLINKDNSLIDYGNLGNGTTIDLSSYDNDTFGYFDFKCATAGAGLNYASLYFNSNYDSYYLDGYNAGVADSLNLYNQNIYSDSASYSAGYQNGYDTALRNSNGSVDVSSASYTAGYELGLIHGQNSSYTAGYTAGYAKARADSSWVDSSTANATDLFWTIGSTPWETFKNIWNVNFLGINIANVITGLVTALIVIWLIKKVWK